jgi:CheY-like chemotaxis protein
MPRPTVLVVEPEPMEALSTRKLVLETGKFNVLTAHSTGEALELFNLFPHVSGVVLVEGDQLNCPEIASAIRKSTAKAPIMSLQPNPEAQASYANYTLSSYEPGELLDVLRDLFGDPRDLERRSANDSAS